MILPVLVQWSHIPPLWFLCATFTCP
jgi:hypothetical protein